MRSYLDFLELPSEGTDRAHSVLIWVRGAADIRQDVAPVATSVGTDLAQEEIAFDGSSLNDSYVEATVTGHTITFIEPASIKVNAAWRVLRHIRVVANSDLALQHVVCLCTVTYEHVVDSGALGHFDRKPVFASC